MCKSILEPIRTSYFEAQIRQLDKTALSNVKSNPTQENLNALKEVKEKCMVLIDQMWGQLSGERRNNLCGQAHEAMIHADHGQILIVAATRSERPKTPWNGNHVRTFLSFGEMHDIQDKNNKTIKFDRFDRGLQSRLTHVREHSTLALLFTTAIAAMAFIYPKI